MEKKKYFVDIGSGEISQIKYDNNDSFTIYATMGEISLLRAKLENMHDAGVRTFFRAHVPIMPYHLDKSNDDYDSNLMETYQMLYDLGDDQVKKYIENTGIIPDNHM